jgi:hypothetical protein
MKKVVPSCSGTRICVRSGTPANPLEYAANATRADSMANRIPIAR